MTLELLLENLGLLRTYKRVFITANVGSRVFRTCFYEFEKCIKTEMDSGYGPAVLDTIPYSGSLEMTRELRIPQGTQTFSLKSERTFF